MTIEDLIDKRKKIYKTNPFKCNTGDTELEIISDLQLLQQSDDVVEKNLCQHDNCELCEWIRQYRLKHLKPIDLDMFNPVKELLNK